MIGSFVSLSAVARSWDVVVVWKDDDWFLVAVVVEEEEEEEEDGRRKAVGGVTLRAETKVDGHVSANKMDVAFANLVMIFQLESQ